MACSEAATLRHRVTLQSPSQEPDGQGGFTEVWADETGLWASIEPLSGYERMQAMQLRTDITHKITIRYRSGVTTKKRLLYRGRLFDIKEVINKGESNRLLIIRAVERA